MGNFIDLTGKKIGYLTIQYRAKDWVQPSGQHKRMWHCICDCGKECDVRASDLKSGNTTSCGCQSSKVRSVGLEDLTGKIFGDFIVMHRAPNKITPSGQATRIWHCKCQKCGFEKDIQASQLKTFSGKCKCSKLNEKQIREENKRISIEQRKEIKKYLVKEEKVASPNINKTVIQKKKDFETVKNVNKYIQKEQKDFTYHNFGILSVEKLDRINNGRRYWLCECQCGNRISIDEKRLIKGKTLSCGCVEKEERKKQAEEKRKIIEEQRKILKESKSLINVNPELASEFHPRRNGLLKIENVAANSSKKIWWLGKCGHEWEATVGSRNRGCGCPFCSGRRASKGKNDLATTHPQLLKEWDYEKNIVSPEEISYGSNKKVWWICSMGHSFEQGVAYKTKSKLDSTCPYCSHQKLLVGYNDLATTHPYILKEWDYEKNTMMPTQMGVGTHHKVWWKCPFGHSYQAVPSHRCGKTRSGCPICIKENHTSFPEQAILYYMKKCFPNTVNSNKEIIGMELDIYIPEKTTAVEYDGLNWHKNNSYEKKKNEVCKEKGIRLIRIREEGLELYDDCECLTRNELKSDDSLSKVIADLLKILNCKYCDVDVARDSAYIYSSYIETRKEKSLANTYPGIAKEWNYEKNLDLTPMMVAPLSNKKVWWVGECGHEYKMEISNRTNQNCGCPICTGKRVLSGYNDFETWCKENNPLLLDEWDFTKNTVKPSEVTKSSDKKVFWKCKKCSNEWVTKIDHRTRMKSGCPKCAGTVREAKSIINIDTGEVFASAREAGRMCNLDSSTISKVCKGKLKQTGGFRWTYLEENKD